MKINDKFFILVDKVIVPFEKQTRSSIQVLGHLLGNKLAEVSKNPRDSAQLNPLSSSGGKEFLQERLQLILLFPRWSQGF